MARNPRLSNRSWKRERLGPSYLAGVQWRQVRVGREIEPVVVLRLLEDVQSGDELVMTRRTLDFVADGVDFELQRAS